MGLMDSINPIAAGTQSLLGIGQAVIGGIKARKYQRQLENLQTPRYNESKGILDYYNQALQRYNQNPYNSQQYNYAMQQIGRNNAAGVNALQSRASAVGGISRLAAIANDSALKAGVNAEQEQNQRFGQLGQAAQMKQGEERMAFQQNQEAPFEKQYNLLAQRAGAANQLVNAGLSNIMGGLGSAQDYGNINAMYGTYRQPNNNTAYGGGQYSPDYYSAKRNGLFSYGG